MNDRIRILRKSLGFTLKKFGERLGISEGAVSNIEKGNRNVTEQMIKSICREFSINENWLRTGEGAMQKPLNIEFGEICARIGVEDEKAKQLIIDYWHLSDEDKYLFWKFFEKFMK